MNTTLTEVLTGLLVTVTQAKDFILAELPDVIQQLLMWKAIYNFIWFVAWLSIAGIAFYVYKRLDSWINSPPVAMLEKDQERADTLVAKGYGGRSYAEDKELSKLCTHSTGSDFQGLQYLPLSLMIVPIGVALANCVDWLQILVAPKVYLIEYAASLAGGQA